MFRRRIKGIALAGLLVVGLMTVPAGPASASSGKCSQNACEWVQNAYTGSDFIYYVDVYDPNSNATHTLRLLFNGSVIQSWTGASYPGIEFVVNMQLEPGTCIQGGIVGLDNARTPCWYAP